MPSKRARPPVVDAPPQSEAQYAAAFDAAPFGIAVTTLPAGTIVRVNDAFLRLFEFGRDEVIGRTSADLGICASQSREEVATRFARDGRLRGFRCVRRTKSGAERILAINVDPVTIDGQPHCLTTIADITEREHAEQALRDSETRSRADLAALTRMHELSTRALGAAGLEPLLQEVMDATVGVLGADKGTLQLLEGDSLRIVAHHGHRQPFLEFFAHAENQASACGTAMERLERVIVPDVEDDALFAGTPSLLVLREAGVRAVQSTPIVSRTGALLGILTTHWAVPYSPDDHDLWRIDLLARQAADLIDLQRAEQTLREASTRFQAILDHAPVAMYVKDREGRFVLGNRGLERFTGRPLEATIGTTDYDWSPADDADRWREHDLQVLHSGRVLEFEETGTDAQGRRYTNLSVKFPLTDGAGTPFAICGISTDITERKRAEEERERLTAAAQQERERMAALVGSITDEIWFADADRNLTLVNPAVWKEFGTALGDTRSVEKIAARFEVYRSDGTPRPVDEAPPLRALAGETVTDEEIVRTPASGELRHRQVRAAPVRNSDGAIIGSVAVVRDITEKVRAAHALAERESDLRRANSQLEEADRRKDEFLAILSHELRNPIAPIRYALPVLQKAGLTDEAATAIGVIERQLVHLTRLVDDLLDVSRITTNKIELRSDHVTLRTIVREAIEAAAPAVATGGHSLKVDVPDEPLWVHGDAARLSQVITNLLDNSAKYTPRGGQLEVAVSCEGEQAVIRVRDNGIGIPAGDLAAVFEMFHQVDRVDKVQGGLGIGLALVKRLVDLHGGTVEARSAGVGQGAEFTVRLPLAREAPRTAADAVTPTSAATPLRVLVVDDNADLVAMLAVFVESLGHEVRKAFDGVSAISAAASYHPDVVLLDLGLPGVTGLEVARELRRRPETAGTHLVALTGWGQANDRQATREAGFDAHLTKPTDPDVLGALLNKVSEAARDR